MKSFTMCSKEHYTFRKFVFLLSDWFFLIKIRQLLIATLLCVCLSFCVSANKISQKLDFGVAVFPQSQG